MNSQLETMRQRRDYLSARIVAKESQEPKWDSTYDVRERDALAWAIDYIVYVLEWLEHLTKHRDG